MEFSLVEGWYFSGENSLLKEALAYTLTREAHPIRAAERRKTLATGASPWFFERK
jgi:hypothetical protein